MKEALSPHAKIVDPFAEKEGGFNMGNLAKTVLAGLGIHSAIDFFRNRKTNDTKQDKRDTDELKKIEKEMRKNKELQKKLNAKGMTLDDVLQQMKKSKKIRK
jgi:predicted RNase H-like nuclease (RuvC/YqgF family)